MVPEKIFLTLITHSLLHCTLVDNFYYRRKSTCDGFIVALSFVHINLHQVKQTHAMINWIFTASREFCNVCQLPQTAQTRRKNPLTYVIRHEKISESDLFAEGLKRLKECLDIKIINLSLKRDNE
jgi:hypothetical protein